MPGLLLVARSASSVGYAIASVLPQMAANVISQLLVVFVLMFSPLNFPVDRLPRLARDDPHGPPGAGHG